MQRTSEIISSVLELVYPDDPGYLWTELQTSTTVSKILGDETVWPPSCDSGRSIQRKGMGYKKTGFVYYGRHRQLQSTIGLHSWVDAIPLYPGRLASPPAQ